MKTASLSLYRVDQHTYTDHVSDDIDAPAYALAAAKAETLEALDWWQTHTGVTGVVDGVEQQVGTRAEWDDWHITSLSRIALGEPYTSLGLEVYSFSYELHSPPRSWWSPPAACMSRRTAGWAAFTWKIPSWCF